MEGGIFPRFDTQLRLISLIYLVLRKVFQILVDGENIGADTYSIRDTRNFIEQFQGFLEHYNSQPSLVARNKDVMKDLYLDEEMRYVANL